MNFRITGVGLLTLFFIGCSGGGAGGNSVPTPTFEQNLQSAKDLLATTPTGTKVVAEYNRLSSAGNLVGVKTLNGPTSTGHGGGIREISPGVYEIDLIHDLSVEDLAQGLAHELVHVKNEIAEDGFLSNHRDLDARMGQVHDAITSHSLGAFYSDHKSDVDFFFTGIMFEEVKAYQRNLQLEKEGIPFNNSGPHDKGLFNYIRWAYVPPDLTLSAADDGKAFVKTVEQYDNVADFTKDYLTRQ